MWRSRRRANAQVRVRANKKFVKCVELFYLVFQVHPSSGVGNEYIWRRYTDISVTIHREQARGEGLVNRHCDWLEEHLSGLSEQRQCDDSLLDTPNPSNYVPRGNRWIHSSIDPGPPTVNNKTQLQENTRSTNTSKLCIIL